MQWNVLEAYAGVSSALLSGLPEHPWVYFVHSYAPELSAATVAVCDYGGPVVAVAEQGAVWGTQFHPEKSGATGLAILANFVAACDPANAASGGGSAHSPDVPANSDVPQDQVPRTMLS
jgi:imidazoleglycerol phosphate synthase glutamine amidotransferase subunit HisH